MGKLKDTLDSVGEYFLGAKEVNSMFGHFIKYRVKVEQVQEQVRQPAIMSAFDVLILPFCLSVQHVNNIKMNSGGSSMQGRS